MHFISSAALMLGTATLGVGVLGKESSHPRLRARQPVPWPCDLGQQVVLILPVDSLTDPRKLLTSTGKIRKGGADKTPGLVGLGPIKGA